MIPATINITAVQQVGDYALHLSFDDHTAQTVDFKFSVVRENSKTCE
jgi:DUF971 family protein